VLPPASDEGDPLPQTDDAEGPTTLPQPELNPLLNPLLGQNLGRWAEVYFTTPPDRREEALQGLLRELEAQQSVPENASFSDDAQVRPFADTNANDPGWPGGMAGLETYRREEDVHHRAWSPDGPSPDQAGRQAVSAKTWYSTLSAALRRHYLYAGSAFAFVGILTLAYTVWLGAPGTSGSSLPAPVPAAAVGPSAGAQSQPAVTRVQNSRENDARSKGSRGVSYDATGTSSNATGPANAPVTSGPGSDEAAAALTPAGTRAAVTPSIGASPDGSQELALAKSILSGNGGKERNSEEAAGWLWKAVAKQNAEATDLLATLYLEGDGVPKNCDQARLLLDAAARKGVKDAAARLQHLPASGCE